MLEHVSGIFLSAGLFAAAIGMWTQSDATQLVAVGTIIVGGAVWSWSAWRKAQIALSLEESKAEVERRAIYTAECRQECEKLRGQLQQLQTDFDSVNRKLVLWESRRGQQSEGRSSSDST